MKSIKKITALLLSVIMIAGIMAIMPVSANAAETAIRTTGADSDEIVSISAGSNMSAAVRSDGSLWTWGGQNLNKSGATWGNYWSYQVRTQSLGVAAGNIPDSTPIMAFSSSTKSVKCSLNTSDTNMGSSNNPVVPPVTTVLKDDNSLWIWGGAKYGVLGNNQDNSVNWQPTKLFDNVISYDTSGYHSAAVTNDGSLYMWGYNEYGQLGDETTDNKLEPVYIMGNVKAVSLGSYHSIILKNDGSVWACGKNTAGQIGNNSTDNVLKPVKVFEDAKAISAGDSFSAALKNDGNLYLWGYNSSGQLGLGNNTTQKVPCINNAFDGDVASIATGSNHSAAILKNGDLYMWGDNWGGQLGDSSTTSSNEPFRLLKNIKMVSLGNNHSLAVTNENKILGWGYNSEGVLGNFSTERKTVPVEIKLGIIKSTFDGDRIEAKTISTPWDDTYLYDSSTDYNVSMATCGIILSQAAYSNYYNVFNQFGFKHIRSDVSTKERPGYAIGYKVLWNFDSPSVEIIMAVRGTTSEENNYDLMTDLRSVFDNFDAAGDKLISELNEAKTAIVSALKKEGIDISLTKKNTKYFLTGHSLGGACAGKIALRLVDKGLALPDNINAYTFATPKFNTDPTQDKAVPRLFNVIHRYDTLVPSLSPCMYNGAIFIPAYRAGTDRYYYTSPSANPLFAQALKDLYGYVPSNWNNGYPDEWKAHMTPIYLAAILSTVAQNKGSDNPILKQMRIMSVMCPVDIEVYDSNGTLCAKTENGVATYPPNSPIIIKIDGDKKSIQIPDDREYTIKYVGTDNGTMRIEDKIYDEDTKEICSEKIYEDVLLEKGKLFSSAIDGSDTTVKEDLYVIDNEDDRIASVAENGEETILAKYDITDYDIEIGEKNFKYDGTEKTQEIIVDDRLTEGIDYRIIYENNKNVGVATVTVKGINEYSGRISKSFNIYDNGTIGDSISWELNPIGILTLSGTGELPDYDDENKAPWGDNSKSIKKVLIEDGITSVGNNSFIGCENLSDLYIPTSVTQIGDNATDGCSELSEIHYEGTDEQWNEITIGTNNAKITENEKTYNSEMHIHDLKKVESKEATYTDAGNTEYWVCKSCNKYYSDSEGKNEIEKDSWIIPKLIEPTEPSTSESNPTEPSSSESQPTVPSSSESDPTEPSTSESNTTEPGSSENNPLEPSSSENQPTEPSSSSINPTAPTSSESTEPTEPNTNKPSEPASSEPITEPEATKAYKFLPNNELENKGCSYKLLVQDNKGNLLTFDFSATSTYLDGVKLYTANVPESIVPTMLIYQFFDGDTWVGQVTKTYNELTSVYGSIVKADGTIYGEETPTDKPSEPTEPTTDKTVEPTEKPSDSSGSSSTVAKTNRKNNPIKVSVKTKSVKAKSLKRKKQTVKPLTITKNKGAVVVTLVKSGTTKKIRSKVTVSKKGIITLKKGKYTKGSYKIKVKIVAKGNSKFKSKTINKTLKIIIK